MTLTAESTEKSKTRSPTEGRAAEIAQTFPEPVLMEDHDGAYWAWGKAGLSNRILVHFDAHIDFAWILPSAGSLMEEKDLGRMLSRVEESPLWNLSDMGREEMVHIGNYVHEAIRNQIAREFIWVYPDGTDPQAQSRAVAGILQNLAADSPRNFEMEPFGESGRFRGRIYGAAFQALPFSLFAEIVPAEKVLLDIDLDFLVVRSLDSPVFPYQEPLKPGFWLSPEEFVGALQKSGLSSDFLTLAFSVEEGYTLLRLKFLGHELSRRLTGALSEAESRLCESLRAVNDPESPLTAKTKIALLESQLPHWVGLDAAGTSLGAALHFNLACLFSEAGQRERGQDLYRQAVEEDPSYATAYSHPGPVLEFLGRHEEAQASYERLKSLDPDNPHVQIFEMETRLKERNWKTALEQARELVRKGFEEPQVFLGLSQALVGLGSCEEAWEWLGRCDSCQRDRRLASRYFELKARAAQGMGWREQALEFYKAALRHSLRAPKVHWALARLYFSKGNFYKARRHAWKAFRQRERES